MPGVRSGVGCVAKVMLAPVGSIVAVRTRRPHLILTFDDGPDPDVTPSVLDTLAGADATATFFVLGTRVARFGRVLDDVVAAGHEIALHGPDHRRLSGTPFNEARDRLRAARRELEDRVQRPVRWFRPPYGSQSLATWAATRAAGMRPVFWGPTLWDWRDVDEAQRRARAREGVRAGAILLGHDGIAGPDDLAEASASGVLDRGAWFRERLSEYAAAGLAGVSLSDALVDGSPVVRARFSR